MVGLIANALRGVSASDGISERVAFGGIGVGGGDSSHNRIDRAFLGSVNVASVATGALFRVMVRVNVLAYAPAKSVAATSNLRLHQTAT